MMGHAPCSLDANGRLMAEKRKPRVQAPLFALDLNLLTRESTNRGWAGLWFVRVWRLPR